MANEFKIKNGLVSDGNIVVTGSITATGGINISGSIASSETASFAPSYTLSSSFNSYTSSASSSVGSLSSSVATTTSELSSSIGSLSGSVATTTSGLASRIGSVETKTGSYATTGSNIFVGSQVITGSLYITNDMVVQGCSCLQNITASAVSIGTNVVMLNTATPAVRFAGISVQDSGSNAGVTGSIFWDGLCNKWIYSNPSTVGYSGGMLISGPRNTGTIGNESPLTCNVIAKSGGGDHIYDSCIIDDGTTVCVNAKLEVRSSDLNNIFVTNPDTTGTTTGSGIGFRAYNGTSVAQAAGVILTSNTWSYGTYSANQLSIGVDGTGGLALRSANSAPISFFTGGATAGISTERMRITNTGLIGINETSPASIGTGYGALTVGGCSGGGINFKINDNATVPGQIWANSTDMVFKTNGSKPFTFYTDDTMAVKIASGGNVGIGTTNPNIYGLNFTKQVTISNTETSQYANISVVGGSGASGGIDFGNQTVRHAGVYGLDGSNLGFYTNGTNSGNGLLERMSITKCGKVGIGATNPRWLLEICANNACGGAGQYPAISINNVCSNGYSAYYFYKGADQVGGMEMSNGTGHLLINSPTTFAVQTSGNNKLLISGANACFGVDANFCGSTYGIMGLGAKVHEGTYFVYTGPSCVLTLPINYSSASSIYLFGSLFGNDSMHYAHMMYYYRNDFAGFQGAVINQMSCYNVSTAGQRYTFSIVDPGGLGKSGCQLQINITCAAGPGVGSGSYCTKFKIVVYNIY